MTPPLAAFGAVIQKGRAYATGHKECDDSWYSCPKSSGGCADDSRPKECDCGADEWAAVVAALPRPDDPEAVEALAKWLWGQYDRAVCITSEVADTVGTPWEMAGERHQNMKRLEARAILSALAAGGGK